MNAYVAQIRAEAQEELRQELRRRAVEVEKQRIRERMKRGWFKRLFPFEVTIKRST